MVAKTTVGERTEENSFRIPDAIVCQPSLWEEISDRPGAGVLDFAEKPILVEEIVSNNRRDDGRVLVHHCRKWEKCVLRCRAAFRQEPPSLAVVSGAACTICQNFS